MQPLSFRALLSAMLLTAISCSVQASDSERHVSVSGTEVYIGVIPAEIIDGYPTLHGRKPGNHHRYHVLIALFDSASGERIAHAEVRARVSLLGTVNLEKELEPMHSPEMVSYGNFFKMAHPGQYRIEVRFKRSQQDKEYSQVRFLYQRPQDASD